MESNDNQLDSVVREIVERFRVRAALGKEKYGTDLDRQDLDLLDWITHFREEMMDGLLYITRIEHELRKANEQTDSKKVYIFESPDGGKTIRKREFGTLNYE